MLFHMGTKMRSPEILKTMNYSLMDVKIQYGQNTPLGLLQYMCNVQ